MDSSEGKVCAAGRISSALCHMQGGVSPSAPGIPPTQYWQWPPLIKSGFRAHQCVHSVFFLYTMSHEQNKQSAAWLRSSAFNLISTSESPKDQILTSEVFCEEIQGN